MTTKATAPLDWRDPADYKYFCKLNPDRRRWEFLRRSQDYREPYAVGLLSDPREAFLRFALVGGAPDPSIRGDRLQKDFRFARYGEICGQHPAFWLVPPLPRRSATPPTPTTTALRKKIANSKRVAAALPSMHEGLWAYDLERAVEDQVGAFRDHLLRLRMRLKELKGARTPPKPVLPHVMRATVFDALLASTSNAERERNELRREWLADWASEEDLVGSIELAPDRKPKEAQASVKLLRVLDAFDAEASNAEIAEVVFRSSPSNASTGRKKARLAAKAATEGWP